jgi:D-arabinose 1-dehydrogenase-like Zn-dependent alcohol dehydrogenase
MEMKPVSRRSLMTAAAIVPFSAVRGTAANSAVTVGLIGSGARGMLDAQYLAQVEGARLVALADLFPERIGRVRTVLKAEDVKTYNRDTELLEKSGVDAVIVTVQLPQSILLDICPKVCHFSLDECESGSARKATRGGGGWPSALQPAQP